MASHVFVIDSAFRRTQIKTTPGKYLREMLEEACLKLKLDPEQHTLKNNNKPLDLSLTFRLSGLAGGAKLQLTQASRSPSVVSIALQLPAVEGGTRLSDRFPSTTSLWLVLRKFEEGAAGDPRKRLNLTQRGVPSTSAGAGKLEYEQPVVNIMGRDLGSFVDLQKTLAQLGFNGGSVLLRLNFKSAGAPMEEAMAQISGYFTAADAAAALPIPPATTAAVTEETQGLANGAHAATVMSSAPDADVENPAVLAEADAGQDPSRDTIMTPPPDPLEAQRPVEDDSVIASSSVTAIPSDTITSTPLEEVSPPGPQMAVYAPSSNPTPFAAQQAYNPADFEPSVEHAHSHQATLNRAAQNRRLQSDAELAAASQTRNEQLASINTATLRVRFPDQMMVDLTIAQSDTAATLYATVTDMLDRPLEPFSLRYTGPKGTPVTLDKARARTLIQGLGMSGRVLVTMVWDTGVGLEARQAPVLKAIVRSRAQELKVPVAAEGEVETVARGEEAKPDKKGKAKSKGDVEARMKKMLGFGKK